jgi:KaiC/GvpD/RAD55 family RecA-like ATPase
MTDLTVGSTNITKLLRGKYKQMKATGWVSLVQVPTEHHLVINTEALKVLINEMGYQCIYITLGKTCTELDKIYKKSGVDVSKLYFVDAISQMYGEKTSSSKRCVYTAGPLDVDSITSSLRDLLASLSAEKKCVFLDSVTTVLLYNSLPRTVRFSQFLTQTLKKMNVTGIMVSIAKGETTTRLVQELSKLCDEVLTVTTGEVKRGGGLKINTIKGP